MCQVTKLLKHYLYYLFVYYNIYTNQNVIMYFCFTLS